MAHCPNCGSSHIQLQQETQVNWGRAVAGWALFGIVGGAVGAVTGNDRHSNACIDCGTTWKAADLYKSRQIFKALTQKELDLQFENDRFLLNEFIVQISPYLEAIPKEEEETKKLVEQKEKDKYEKSAMGYGWGLMLGIGGCNAIAGIPGAGTGIGFFMFILFTIIGTLIGAAMDKLQSQQFEQQLKQLKLDREKAKRKAEKELEFKVKEFLVKYDFNS